MSRRGGHQRVSRGICIRDRWCRGGPLWQNTPSTLPGISPTCRRGRMSETPCSHLHPDRDHL